MRSDLSIARLTPSHAGELARLEALCFSDPWPEDFARRRLEDPLCVFFGAVTRSRDVAGYIGLSVVLDEGYILNVAVAPEHRRQGVGAALVAHALEHGRERGLAFLTLEVRESNAAARALYTEAGFAPVGRREAYYERPAEAALLMTRFY